MKMTLELALFPVLIIIPSLFIIIMLYVVGWVIQKLFFSDDSLKIKGYQQENFRNQQQERANRVQEELERQRQQREQQERQRQQREQQERQRQHTDNATESDIKSTWHIILGVSVNASAQEIKSAYRKRISEYHPDKVSQLGERLKEVAKIESQKINAAYEYARDQELV